MKAQAPTKIDMNKLIAIIFTISCLNGFSQVENENNLVRVEIQGTDETVLINAIDLVGIWTNIASTPPILNGFSYSVPTIEIQNGFLVTIEDGWQADYPNKLKNSTWKIIDNELEFYAPEVGAIPVSLSKLKGSNRFDLTVNNFTYRKTVILSTEPTRN